MGVCVCTSCAVISCKFGRVLTAELIVYTIPFEIHALIWNTLDLHPLYDIKVKGKSILQVPDTGTWVLDNTRPFLCSSIVGFWITLARSKKAYIYHIFRQYWYTKNVPVFTNTGTFQYLGYTFSRSGLPQRWMNFPKNAQWANLFEIDTPSAENSLNFPHGIMHGFQIW